MHSFDPSCHHRDVTNTTPINLAVCVEYLPPQTLRNNLLSILKQEHYL
jgi:hypothetical protein